MKPLAISIGCPAGVGPEVLLSALASQPTRAALVIGDPALLEVTALRLGMPALARCDDPSELGPGEVRVWSRAAPLARMPPPGKPNRAAGAAQLAWIDQALELVSTGRCAALVTGPVSKQVIARSGARGSRSFRGHTEYLAKRLAAEEVVMAFAAQQFATSLVTTHLPLRRVARAITAFGVESASFWLAQLLCDLGRGSVRIAVAGLNPHAGEQGLLGGEELNVIGPGIVRARRRIARARLPARLVGPMAAESAFRLAAAGEFHGVVSMYHDQATIACKLLGFGEAVNVTLGLPIIRTSVDHGTAYDLAGTGRASDAGMRAAIALAIELANVADYRRLGTSP